MVARGRDLDIATQASTIEPFREVREDLIASSHAYHLGELIDVFLQDRDAHPEVFVLFRDALAALAAGVIPPSFVARHFELHLLGAVGFRPQLTSCLSCSAEIAPESNYYSTTMGGAYCPSCGPREVSALPIGVDTLKLLRYLQRNPTVESLAVRPADSIGREVERLLRRQIEF